ncbi:MAG: hypothetical protein RL571_3357 [Pseudomonadota bacterium]|jgi:hypothetical protein
MAECNTDSPLAKPNYRLWLSYFCLPLLVVLLGSVVLWVVQVRTCSSDLTGLFNYFINSWRDWQFVLILLPIVILLLIPLQLLLDHELKKNQRPDRSPQPLFRYIGVLICRSYPLLPKIWVYLCSKRFDLLACAALGIWVGYLLAITFIYDAIFVPNPPLDTASDYWLLLYGLLLLPGLGLLSLFDSAFAKFLLCLRVGVFTCVTQYFTAARSKHNLGRIQPDAPIDSVDQDLFAWEGKVTAFGREVLQADGTAFGVEAPWGTGKTSFINLCEKYWRDEQSEYKVVVYRFELLKYAGNPDLIQQFVLGLLEKLQQDYYLPELSGAVQGYLGSLQGALELSGGPLKLTLNNQPNSIEEALAQIEAQLDRRLPQNFRLVVVIDDLDRAEPSSVRDLLFALHKCFPLPRLRYVLCYDQQQLAHKAELHRQHGGDLSSQTLYEFLDKFVGARIFLQVPEYGLQKEYLRLKAGWQNGDEIWREIVDTIMTQAVELSTAQANESKLWLRIALNNQEKPESKVGNLEYIYSSFLGNVRQLRHLFNQLCLCWPKGVPIKLHDFDAADLLHLLLLQSEFPAIYRELCSRVYKNEYRALLIKRNPQDESKYEQGEGLSLWFESLKLRHLYTAIQQDRFELLMLKLFHHDLLNLKDHDQHDCHPLLVRAGANQGNLLRYLHLIELQTEPDLHNSWRYPYLFRQKWLAQGDGLAGLLREYVLAPRSDWQDQHEYALWQVLLAQFNHYTPEQQRELLTEYLQALPRFHAIETFTPGRVDMANLLGQLIANGHSQGQEILSKIWFDLLNAMLRDDRTTNVLLGYQDAMLVYFEISYQAPRELVSWAHKVLWEKFQKQYLTPKRALQDDRPTGKAIAGTRSVTEAPPARLREFLLATWMRLRSLSTKQTDTTLSQKIEDWLFEVCWGEASPNHEQLEWWLDFLWFYWNHDRIKGGLSMGADLTLRERMKKFSLKHKAEIEQRRQQQSGVILRIAEVDRSKAEVLREVLTELHDGKNWDEIVEGGGNASAAE